MNTALFWLIGYQSLQTCLAGQARRAYHPRLFWREIIGGAKHNAAIGQSTLFQDTHDAEIGEFDEGSFSAESAICRSTTPRQHNVLWFYITMNKAACMRYFQDITDLGRDID